MSEREEHYDSVISHPCPSCGAEVEGYKVERAGCLLYYKVKPCGDEWNEGVADK